MIELAMLGMDERGRQRLQCLAALPGVAVKKVCARDEAARRWVKSRYPEIETATEPRHALADLSIQAVVLALPPAEQAAFACQALASGKHCLLEWPPALSLADLRELQAFSRERKRMCATSLPLLFHPGAVQAQELIRHRDLGQLFYLSATRREPAAPLIEQHVTWSLAPEEIALALWWLGESPRRVRATGFYFLNHRADTVALQIEFLSGRQALIGVSTLDAEPVREFSVVGSRRSLRLDLAHPGAPLALHTPARPRGTIGETSWKAEARSLSLPEVNPLEAETRHFLACLNQGQVPLADLDRVEEVLRVLAAADLSLRYDGAQVDVARQAVQIPMGWRTAA
jgi:predicted dehydrogenase